MNDNDLLKSLSDIAREERDAHESSPPGPWLALTHGELAPEERALLERRAEADEALRAAVAAYRPLVDDVRARITTDALAAVGSDAVGNRASTRETTTLARSRRPPGGWRIAAACAAAVPLAAAGFLLVAPRAPVARDALPDYVVEIEGEVSALRGGSAARDGTVHFLRAGGNAAVTIVLRPSTRAVSPLSIHTYCDRAGALEQESFVTELSEEGAVRIVADQARLQRCTGIVLVVEHASTTPPPLPAALALANSGQSRGDGWVAVRVPIEVR